MIIDDNQLDTDQEAEGLTLHSHIRCTKYPGHKGFIPINEFKIDHLPIKFRNQEIFEMIRHEAKLTVRIECKFISTDRPEFYPMLDQSAFNCSESFSRFKKVNDFTPRPYPLFKERGKDIKHFGSGKIIQTFRETGETLCNCDKCKKLSSPRKICGTFAIKTAAHVIFDNQEAKNATCTLFYDSEKCHVKNIYGNKVFSVNPDRDICNLICEICDESLFKEIGELLTKTPNLINHTTEEQFVVVISHPHGRAKQISFGSYLGGKEIEMFNLRFTYNAPTCHGSSGATLIIVGYSGKCWSILHVGSKSMNINYSSIGQGFNLANSIVLDEQHFQELTDLVLCSKKNQSKITDIATKIQNGVNFLLNTLKAVVNWLRKATNTLFKANSGCPQTDRNISVYAEAYLYKHLPTCKFSNHMEFIQASTLTKNDLPENCQDDDVFEVCKCLIALTAHITVRMVSFERPEYYPDSTLHYPLYNMRRSRTIRLGSAFITDITQCNDRDATCSCVQCCHSDDDKGDIFNVIVCTARLLCMMT